MRLKQVATRIAASLSLLVFLSAAHAAPPSNFTQAKVLAKNHVYHDQNQSAEGTLYCGCKWNWVGKSGGRVDHNSCGYRVRSQENRAERTEWEHALPASSFGQQRQCWQNGGRKNCTANDPVFSRMEADLFNLFPSVGEVNGDRSNYPFGVAQVAVGQYGQCQSKTDFKGRTFEPRDEAKGQVARTLFYMHDHYNLRMSDQQQRLMMAWDKQFPVTAWESERNKRITRVMGHTNPFVTGEKRWTLGHKNEGGGVGFAESVNAVKAASTTSHDLKAIIPVKGNRNSKIYHLPTCSSYNAMSPQNVVPFQSEGEAIASGYRKAGNCR